MYDAIDEGKDAVEVEAPEFTEADLASESIAVVKSEPKAALQDQALDPSLNPYLNPNLDADLSTTIKRANRRTINASDFQLDEKVPQKQSDRSNNTDATNDRTRSQPTGSGGSNSGTRRIPVRP